MTRDNRHSSVKRCLRPTPISLWRYQVGTLSLIGMVTMVALEAGGIPAPAAVLTKWRYDPDANQLEVTLQAQTTPQYFVLAQPPRIVLDLPNTLVGKVVTQQNYSGAVRKVRVSQFQPGVTRIVLELSPEVVLAVGQMQLQRAPLSGKGDRWLLRPGITAQNTSNLTSTTPPVNGSSQQVVVTNVPPSATLPPAIVSVPPLTPINPGVSTIGEPYSKPVIEFGQPLPMTPDTTTPQLPVLQPGAPVLPEVTSSTTTTTTSSVAVPSINSTSTVTSTANSQSPNILLPAGTQLSLRYAGNSLTLIAGSPQQAELLLRSDLRSPTGTLIAPAGTPVSGRFETNDNGSRFIAQAITLQGQNIPFAAKSDILKNRTASTTTLNPEQILQIRLTENLSKF